MPVFEIFSSRKKKAERDGSDVYQYDSIPEKVRAQILHIWNDAIGPYAEQVYYGAPPPHNSLAWDTIRNRVCREQGKMRLSGEDNSRRDCIGYLRAEQDVAELLDLIEFSFLYVEAVLGDTPSYERQQLGIVQDPDVAIKELNYRFREAGIGYQFENGKIIRMDSQFIHDEVVRPALSLLSDSRFRGAEEEFLSAHAHFRAGDYKDTVTDALKAFESTMKAICDIKGWSYAGGSRATDLLKIIRRNGLLPDYLDNSFDQLAATLQSGLPKVRNEAGGHGQGATPKQTPDYIAAYALHIAAAKIVLLVEAFRESN